MPTQRIVSRFDGRTLYECEAESLLEALHRAVKGGANLSRADLSGLNLFGAYLSRANLSRVNLSGADLSGVNLSRVNLSRANLSGANLSGATIDWTSYDVVAELLRRAAGDSVDRRMLAGLVLVSRDWCWKKFLAIEHPERGWALGALRGYVREGDNAPDALKEEVA